jgi:hypothetical protein
MLAFGLLLLLNALGAHETMSGNEPARIRDAASAAVESDLKRATMSEGSGSGMDGVSKASLAVIVQLRAFGLATGAQAELAMLVT